MAFATRAVDFANVDALLKAAEILEGTLNNRFAGVGGIEKTNSDINLRTNMYPRSQQPSNGNYQSTGKRDQLPKLGAKDQSAHSQHNHQEILRVKSDNITPLAKFCYNQKNTATIEQLERTLTASGYHFVKSDEELTAHNTPGPWIDQSNRMDRSGRTTSFTQLASPNQCRIFTAASGLGHDLRPVVNAPIPLEDDPEGSSNTSELEDSCLDNSSQDSFTGHHAVQMPHDSGIPRYLDSSSSNSEQHQLSSISVTNPTTSHCRLRTALLNSPGQLHTVPGKCNGGSLAGRAQTIQSFSSNNRSPRSPSTVNRSLVISMRTEHNTRPHLMKDTPSLTPRSSSPSKESNTVYLSSASNASDLTETHRTVSSHLSIPHTIAPILMNPHLTVNRPPSAAPALLRMSSDSCVERTFSMPKSASQPHSPEYQPRHASMPMSSCRLPMKKRKFDWSQINNEVLTKRADSSPYPVPEHSGFLPNGAIPSSAVNFDGERSVQTPLIINCPMDRPILHSSNSCPSGDIKRSTVPLSAPPSVPPLANDSPMATDDEDLVNHRPHSIPSSLITSPVTIPTEQTTDGTNAPGDAASSIFTLHKTLDNLAAVLSNPSSECLRTLPTTSSGPFNRSNSLDYSQLSLLMRTLTASTLASGTCSSSDPIASQSQQRLISNAVLTNGHVKSGLESVPFDRELTGLLRSNSNDFGARGSGASDFISNFSPGVGNTDTEAANLMSALSPLHRQLVNQRNRAISSVTDSTSTPDRTNVSCGFVQPNERFSSNTFDKQIPRQSFKARRWFTTDSISRHLVTDSRTANPTPQFSAATAVDGWSLNPNMHRFNEIHDEQPVPPSKEATQHGPGVPERLNQTTPDPQVSEATLPTSNGSLSKESRISPPSKLIIDSVPTPRTKEPVSSNCSPSADPTTGAQILMMLSPSEQNRTTQTALDTSLARVGLGGKSTSKFPLLLVSATSSASAAALAAAAAMATGAPPTSLVPVPVQVRTYMPKDDEEQRSQALQSGRTDSNGYANAQRFVLSFCSQEKELNNTDKRFSIVLSSSRSLPTSMENSITMDSSTASPIVAEAAKMPLLQPTAMAHSN